jgi:hypothetical protein
MHQKYHLRAVNKNNFPAKGVSRNVQTMVLTRGHGVAVLNFNLAKRTPSHIPFSKMPPVIP